MNNKLRRDANNVALKYARKQVLAFPVSRALIEFQNWSVRYSGFCGVGK